MGRRLEPTGAAGGAGTAGAAAGSAGGCLQPPALSPVPDFRTGVGPALEDGRRADGGLFTLWGWGRFGGPAFDFGSGELSGADRLEGEEAGGRVGSAGPAGEYGRVGDLARAGHYGPVVDAVGTERLPVIEHSLTGAVREVTPVELEFPANRPYLPAGSTGVVWNPGPRGLGLWRRHDPVRDLRLNRLLLERYA